VTPAVPVLEVGGTHVTSAAIDPDEWTVAGGPFRAHVDSHGSARTILDTFVAAALSLQAASDAAWAVAMPDPFDYLRGIGRFHGVGKFGALDGVDVGSALRTRLSARRVVFCNDADAFTVGEWVAGAAKGTDLVAGITLGTGVGSGWVDRGHIVDPGVPDGGRAHRLQVDGAPLEDVMSRRAIRRAYAAGSTGELVDVREIADRARAGEQVARDVLAHALRTLGQALAGPLDDFGADVVVVGGSMAGSWDLFEPWFRDGAGAVPIPPVRCAANPDGAPLIGAAYVAVTE
jgi:glucokinase